MPVPIPALVGLGTAAYQFFQGERQKNMAKKLKPSNYVPPSVQKAVTDAESMAQKSTMPGYDRAREKLRISSANTISNAQKISSNAGQVQQAVADTDAREKELIKDLEVNNANFNIDARRNANNMSLLKGDYEQRSMDAYNATKSALLGSSARNKFNAVTTLGEGIMYSLPDSAFDGGIANAGTGVNSPTAIKSRMSGKSPFSIHNPPFDYRKYLREMGLI